MAAELDVPAVLEDLTCSAKILAVPVPAVEPVEALWWGEAGLLVLAVRDWTIVEDGLSLCAFRFFVTKVVMKIKPRRNSIALTGFNTKMHLLQKPPRFSASCLPLWYSRWARRFARWLK